MNRLTAYTFVTVLLSCACRTETKNEHNMSAPTSTTEPVAPPVREEKVPITGYGCVGIHALKDGMSMSDAADAALANMGADTRLAMVRPFVGKDRIQRIAAAYFEGEDETGTPHIAVLARMEDGGFEIIYKLCTEAFSNRYLTLVDAQGDGNIEVVFDGNEGGSGGYLYRTVLFDPILRTAYLWESAWGRGPNGRGKAVFKASPNLKKKNAKQISAWFNAHVNGPKGGDDNGGLRRVYRAQCDSPLFAD